jgi:hypothetical protein
MLSLTQLMLLALLCRPLHSPLCRSHLKGLLEREQLFASEYGRAVCEAQARANLSYEWRLLYSGLLLQHSEFDEGQEDVEGEDQS